MPETTEKTLTSIAPIETCLLSAFSICWSIISLSTISMMATPAAIIMSSSAPMVIPTI